ncbi:MAG: hypothetical protein FJZ01_13695 [Candidatus Sericytochromatia bacterium]|nr:hypothetical protein [Candidatus Tanganyikabacteria bacterium]
MVMREESAGSRVRNVGRHGLAAWCAARLGRRVRPEEVERIQQRVPAWLRNLGVALLPGQMRIEAPAGPARRSARLHRRPVVITYADWLDDVELWDIHGLKSLKGWRLLRWCYEIRRQGAWASIEELARLANTHQAAAQRRLDFWRSQGVWVPHIGGDGPGRDRIPLDAWLLARWDDGYADGVPSAAWVRAEMAGGGLLALLSSGHGGRDACGALGRSIEEYGALKEAAGHLPLSRRRGPPLAAINEPGLAGVEAELVLHFHSGRGTKGFLEALDDLAGRLTRLDTGIYCMPVLLDHQPGDASSPREFTVDLWGGDAVTVPPVRDLKLLRIKAIRDRLGEIGASLTTFDVGFMLGMHPEATRNVLRSAAGADVPGKP